MNTFKISGNSVSSIINFIDGKRINLPENPEAINKYTYNGQINNRSRYVVEVSPDKTNPLNFDGIRIAMQLYFKHIQENLLEFEIILFGFDSLQSIFLNYDYAFFLKCPNVRYQQIQYNFQWDLVENIQPINKDIAIDSLKRIGIKPPTSYKTHHSITNEWAIYRWSRCLGVEIGNELEKEIEASLYFQYLITTNKISQAKSISTSQVISLQESIKSKGKILLIDDEEEKGWENFFRKLIGPESELKFDKIGREFKKKKNRKEIKEDVKSKIEKYRPDVVILDLRLHDSDFNEKYPEKLTGYKILRSIKKDINKGIQVIVFSASNKVWNLLKMQDAKADDFILKESPELSFDGNHSYNTIIDIYKSIEDGLKRAFFLKDVLVRINTIKNQIKKGGLFTKDFSESIENNFEIAFKMLYDSFEDEKLINYSYIQLFLLIEQLVNHESFLNGDENIRVKCGDKEVLVQQRYGKNIKRSIKLTDNGKYEISEYGFLSNAFKRADTNFKVSSVLIYRFGNLNSSVKKWTSIYTNRNTKAAHYNKNNNNLINKKDILEILNFINYLTDLTKISSLNVNRGLKERTLNEALADLEKDPRFKKQNNQ